MRHSCNPQCHTHDESFVETELMGLEHDRLCLCAAEALGLPYVPPYLGPPFGSLPASSGGSFRRGASLAVGGATALDAAFFRSRGILPAPSKFPLNASLSVQLEWFESRLKPSLCRTPTQGAYTYNVAVERNNNNSITRATGRK